MPNHSSACPQPPNEASDSFKFRKQLRQLREAFPNWTSNDLETLLIETNGDVQLASTKIIDGVAVQWSDVSRRLEENQGRKGRRRRKNKGGATIHRNDSSHPASIDSDHGFARGAESESTVQDHHEIGFTTSASASGPAEAFSTTVTSLSAADVWGSAACSNAAFHARVIIPSSKLIWSQIARKQQDKASKPNEEATLKLVWEEPITVQDLVWDDEPGHKAQAVPLPHPVNEKAERKSLPEQQISVSDLPRPRPERSRSMSPADTEPPKPAPAAKPSRRIPSRSAAIVRPPSSGPPVVMPSSFVPFDTFRMQFGSSSLGGQSSDDIPEPQPYHLGPKEPVIPGPKEPAAPRPQELLGETKTCSEQPPRTAPRVNTDFLSAIFRGEQRRQPRADREPVRRATPPLALTHDVTANSVVEPIHLTRSATPPPLQQEQTAQDEPPILMSDHQRQHPAQAHTPPLQQPQLSAEQQDLPSGPGSPNPIDQQQSYPQPQPPHPGFFVGQNNSTSAPPFHANYPHPNFYNRFSQLQAHFDGRHFSPANPLHQGSVRAVRPPPPQPRPTPTPPPPPFQQYQPNTPMQQPPQHQGHVPSMPVYFTPYHPEGHSFQSAPHLPGHGAPQLFVMYPVVQGPSGRSVVPAPAPRQPEGNPGGPQPFGYPQVVYQAHNPPPQPAYQRHQPYGPQGHDLGHGRGVFPAPQYGPHPAVVHGPPGQPGMQGFAYGHAVPSDGPFMMHGGMDRSGSSSRAGPGVRGNGGAAPAHGGSTSLVVNVNFDAA